MQKELKTLLQNGLPSLQEPMPRGDMPGDPIFYNEDAVKKAQTLYRSLIEQIDFDQQAKWIISVSGGSGSGKTTLASILAYYFNTAGVKSYILSGDNYPHRIPEYNDAERVQIYREAGQRALVESGQYSEAVKAKLANIYDQFLDGAAFDDDWYDTYHQAGKLALTNYLGTEREINLPAINRVLAEFKAGNAEIWLKRMGRTPDALWYDAVDFSKTKVIFVEWTHGNHSQLAPVDFRLFLNSTPQETLAYRQLRARDGQADSAFVTMVLEIEQQKLHQQSSGASLIFSKAGDVLSYDAYLKLVEGV